VTGWAAEAHARGGVAGVDGKYYFLCQPLLPPYEAIMVRGAWVLVTPARPDSLVTTQLAAFASAAFPIDSLLRVPEGLDFSRRPKPISDRTD
jgi:hypothetical protein